MAPGADLVMATPKTKRPRCKNDSRRATRSLGRSGLGNASRRRARAVHESADPPQTASITWSAATRGCSSRRRHSRARRCRPRRTILTGAHRRALRRQVRVNIIRRHTSKPKPHLSVEGIAASDHLCVDAETIVAQPTTMARAGPTWCCCVNSAGSSTRALLPGSVCTRARAARTSSAARLRIHVRAVTFRRLAPPARRGGCPHRRAPLGTIRRREPVEETVSEVHARAKAAGPRAAYARRAAPARPATRRAATRGASTRGSPRCSRARSAPGTMEKRRGFVCSTRLFRGAACITSAASRDASGSIGGGGDGVARNRRRPRRQLLVRRASRSVSDSPIQSKGALVMDVRAGSSGHRSGPAFGRSTRISKRQRVDERHRIATPLDSSTAWLLRKMTAMSFWRCAFPRETD